MSAREPYPILGSSWWAIDLQDGEIAVLDEESVPFLAVGSVCHHRPPRNRYGYVGILVHRPQGRRQRLLLHRLVMKATTGQVIDHINRDGLDCRRSNLRQSSRSLNAANSAVSLKSRSGFKGVHLERGRWRARIGDNPMQSLGSFDTKEEAAAAYDAAAFARWGNHARLNHPHASQCRGPK